MLVSGVPKNTDLAEKYKKLAVEMQNDVTDGKTLSFQQGLT